MANHSQLQLHPDARPGTRVWLIISAFSTLGYAGAQEALKLGDCVVAGCRREEVERERRTNAAQKGDSEDEERGIQYLKRIGGGSCVVVELAYAGTLEELLPNYILGQFESTFFGPVNIMKSALLHLRKQHGGHIVNVTGLTGQMGTPGLSARCASDHAPEGFSDSLAYEIAPFNIKITIVQPPIEVNILSSPLHLQISSQPAYNDSSNPFSTMAHLLSSPPQAEHILSETISLITHIAALENPPGRIVVGGEGIEQVKDRVKTVLEELEEFLDASLGADIPKQ